MLRHTCIVCERNDQCQKSSFKSFKSIHKQQLKTKNHSEAYRNSVLTGNQVSAVTAVVDGR